MRPVQREETKQWEGEDSELSSIDYHLGVCYCCQVLDPSAASVGSTARVCSLAPVTNQNKSCHRVGSRKHSAVETRVLPKIMNLRAIPESVPNTRALN